MSKKKSYSPEIINDVQKDLIFATDLLNISSKQVGRSSYWNYTVQYILRQINVIGLSFWQKVFFQPERSAIVTWHRQPNISLILNLYTRHDSETFSVKHEPFDDFTLHLQQERNILSCLSVKSSESVVVKLKHASYHFSWTYNHRKNHFEYFNIDILKVSLQNYR